jgi:hypothetical protein
MIARAAHWFLVAWIVILAPGCDNVSWGGFRIGLERPPSDSAGPPGDTAPDSVSYPSELEIGPILFAALRDGDTAFAYAVASRGDDGLMIPPPGEEGDRWTEEILQDRLQPGARLILFSQGVRVGTLTVAEGGTTDAEFCRPRPRVHGRIELVPPAAEVEHFLALEAEAGDLVQPRPYTALQSRYAQRAATVDMAAAAIPQVGARWPASLVDSRTDLQVFQLQGRDGPAVMATFLQQDRLATGRAPVDAYSLLVLGEPRGGGYENTYLSYRLVGTAGKGAPRYFSHLDWDQDGEDEILLQVFGEDTSWWAGLDREGGAWALAFRDACSSPADGASAGPPAP